jgi:hypothetical protein
VEYQQRGQRRAGGVGWIQRSAQFLDGQRQRCPALQARSAKSDGGVNEDEPAGLE